MSQYPLDERDYINLATNDQEYTTLNVNNVKASEYTNTTPGGASLDARVSNKAGSAANADYDKKLQKLICITKFLIIALIINFLLAISAVSILSYFVSGRKTATSELANDISGIYYYVCSSLVPRPTRKRDKGLVTTACMHMR